MHFSVFPMVWIGEHNVFTVKEFVKNGESLITTKRTFRIRFVFDSHDQVSDSF